jgi:hypothetical protein
MGQVSTCPYIAIGHDGQVATCPYVAIGFIKMSHPDFFQDGSFLFVDLPSIYAFGAVKWFHSAEVFSALKN